MRRVIGIIAACSALSIAAVAPASAENLAGQSVSKAYSIMMTNSEGQSLVVGPKLSRQFAVFSTNSGPADSPWLCDLSGSDEVEGKEAHDIISMEFWFQTSQTLSEAVQEIYVYSNEKQAKRAYDDIAKKIKRCEGEHQPAAEEGGKSGNSEPEGKTTRLTNGTKKAADGDSFLWVRSTTTVASPDGIVEHDYKTVRHFGSYLQIVQVQSEGVSASKLTAKQIRITDRLTDQLGDRWSATFR